MSLKRTGIVRGKGPAPLQGAGWKTEADRRRLRVYGLFYNGSEFVKGTTDIIRGEEGLETEFVGQREEYDLKGTVIPSFINSHVHTGDLSLYFRSNGFIDTNLEALVGPGGTKHLVLDKTGEGIGNYIAPAIEAMLATGTTVCFDFREGGVRGIEAAREAATPYQGMFIYQSLGRGECGEWVSAAKEADGLGLSSIRDLGSELDKALKAHGSTDKPLHIHFSELTREDVEDLLDITPEVAVHLCKCTEGDLEKILDSGIFPVICPRVNFTFSDIAPMAPLLDSGFGIGTDNMMLAAPDMGFEVEMLWRTCLRLKRKGELELSAENIARSILNAATYGPRERFGLATDGYQVINGIPESPWEYVMQGPWSVSALATVKGLLSF